MHLERFTKEKSKKSKCNKENRVECFGFVISSSMWKRDDIQSKEGNNNWNSSHFFNQS